EKAENGTVARVGGGKSDNSLILDPDEDSRIVDIPPNIIDGDTGGIAKPVLAHPCPYLHDAIYVVSGCISDQERPLSIVVCRPSNDRPEAAHCPPLANAPLSIALLSPRYMPSASWSDARVRPNPAASEGGGHPSPASGPTPLMAARRAGDETRSLITDGRAGHIVALRRIDHASLPYRSARAGSRGRARPGPWPSWARPERRRRPQRRPR